MPRCGIRRRLSLVPFRAAEKRVLYVAGRAALWHDFLQALGEIDDCRLGDADGDTVARFAGATFRFEPTYDVPSALAAIHREFFNLVVLDLRVPLHTNGAGKQVFDHGLEFLDAMDREPDIERRYGFHRVCVLVSGDDPFEVDRRIAQLGARGVGRVMRDLTECRLQPGCRQLPPRAEFARRVLDEMVTVTQRREMGKVALCASGGGITGLYFEMGALKCLEDCLPPGSLNRFDLYFGISAGGVLCGMLVNGFSITDFMAGVAGVKGGAIPPVDLNLLGRQHLDADGLSAPVRQIAGMVVSGASALLRLKMPFSIESLVFEYGDLLHPPFSTAGFGSLLAKAFTGPGRTDDFRRLKQKLLIGATDQDLKEHVLFGDPPNDDVPISLAIRASMSLNPVFGPTDIDGRFYEDGAVTRTSNFVDAIHRGADLIFALDPLVPYVSKEAGFTRSRGAVYNADQDIRTVSYTRYETTRNFVLRRHPEVSMYTFLPANNLRRLMSVNPMDHRHYLEIWRGAYISTLRRIHALEYRMRGDLAYHGLALDTRRAEQVAARLEANGTPAFADFFPDGRVALGNGVSA